MNSKSSKKNILITGTSSGIGNALCHYFANQGHKVFAITRQDKNFVDTKNIFPLIADVRDFDQLKEVSRKLISDFGITQIDVLINNAGVVIPGPIESLPDSQLMEQFEVNVIGVVRVTKEFLPLLREARGKIINIGSISSAMAIPFIGAYGASKSALKQISWALRLELHPWNIQVSHIEAGNFNTPIWNKAFKQGEKVSNDSLYKNYIAAALENMKLRSGQVNKIALLEREIEKIINNKSKKFNVVVGKDAKRRKLLVSILPNAILEKILLKKFHLNQ